MITGGGIVGMGVHVGGGVVIGGGIGTNLLQSHSQPYASAISISLSLDAVEPIMPVVAIRANHSSPLRAIGVPGCATCRNCCMTKS